MFSVSTTKPSEKVASPPVAIVVTLSSFIKTTKFICSQILNIELLSIAHACGNQTPEIVRSQACVRNFFPFHIPCSPFQFALVKIPKSVQPRLIKVRQDLIHHSQFAIQHLDLKALIIFPQKLLVVLGLSFPLCPGSNQSGSNCFNLN